MYAMILAAGLGTRLGALSDQRPKPMLPVLDQPLVRWAARYAAHHGLARGIVNLHHLGDQIAAELGDGSDLGVALEYSREAPEILGTGGGIREMARRMPREPFVVLNAKIVCDLDLAAALAAHRERGALATMVLYEVPDVERWGAVGIDEEGRVVELAGYRRPAAAGATATAANETVGRYMLTGVHIIEPELIEAIDPRGPCCVIRTAYARLLERDAPVFGYLHRGYFHEHSTPGRYLAGNLRLLDGALDAAGLARSGAPRDVAGKRPLIAADATVDAEAQVGARVVVGRGAEIAAGAQLSDSVVWPAARVEGQRERCIVTTRGVIDVDPATIGMVRHERR